MANRIILLSLLGLISACHDSQADKQKELDGKARLALETLTKDPLAIQLRNVREVATGGLCGEANLRDDNEHYRGFLAFYFDRKVDKTPFIIEPAVFQLREFDKAVAVCLTTSQKRALEEKSSIMRAEWKRGMDKQLLESQIELEQAQLRAEELKRGY